MKLDIGAGLNPYKKEDPEWVHHDIDPGPHLEYTGDWKDLPFEDESLDEIHCGDVIEHIPGWEFKSTLAEWNRILKMGGVISGSMPNLDRVMRDYAAGDPGMTLRDAELNLYGWHDRPGQQHYLTYTKETLTAAMRECGFEINNFNDSPGPAQRPWWLVFSGKKVARVPWRDYHADQDQSSAGSVEHESPAPAQRRNVSKARR